MNPRKLTYLAFALLGGCGLGILTNRAFFAPRTAASAGQTVTIAPEAPPPAPAEGPETLRTPGSEAAHGPQDLGNQLQSLRGEADPLRRARRIAALVEKMDVPQATAFLQGLQERGLIGKEQEFASALIERWAESDPRAAVEFAQSLEDRGQRATLVQAAAGTWAGQDSGAALGWLKDLPAGELRQNVLETMVLGAGHSEPEAALQFLGVLAPYEQTLLDGAESQIFEAWAAEDPAAASARVLALPANNGRDSAMVAVAMTWVETDPQAALAWTGHIADPSTRNSAYFTALARFTSADPQAAASYLASLPEGDARDQATSVAVSELAVRDSQDALKFFQHLPAGPVRDTAALELVGQMSRANPLGAAAFVAGLPPGKAQDHAIVEVATHFGEGDIAGAVGWASKLTGQNRTNALSAILDGWSRDHSAAAAKSLLTLIPAQEQQGVIGGIAASGLPPEQRIAWAQQMADPALRAGIIGNIVEGLTSADPAAAAGYLTKLSGPSQSVATETVATTWARQDPAQAGAWAATLPEGEMRSKAFAGVMSAWAGSDPTAAAGWLEKLPTGTSRDAAVSTFARGVIDTDPESAAMWAKSISNPTAQRAEVESVCRRWLELDSNAATRWISQSSGISAEARNELLRTQK